jgi:hypothetical protein
MPVNDLYIFEVGHETMLAWKDNEENASPSP